jgi:predicted nucleic acid-binding Zn ribbon protein
MKNFEDIGSIIEGIIKDTDIKKRLNESRIFTDWKEIVGSEISKKTRPERISTGTLYLSVTTSIWANELSLMSDMLIEKINSYVGEEVVRKIRFRQNL